MNQDAPYFSLIVSTRFRTDKIVKLLETLKHQSLNDFEVIIVEQNDAALLPDLLPASLDFPLRHFHTPGEVGCSRGRNNGLRVARGQFLIFPDDDCWYPPDFLKTVRDLLISKQADIVTGRPRSEDGRIIHGRFETEEQWITRDNVWTTQVEWLAVWRAELLREIEGFDLHVGVGATTPWQSAEGQELMLRALQHGARAWYDPELVGYDGEEIREIASAEIIAKQRRYGRGMTYVMRKHRLGAPLMAYFVARAFGGALVAALRAQPRLARFHLATAIGRIEGAVGRVFGEA